MSKIIDIYSKGEYPANILSNFYPNAFTLDGVECASMEGFLQSLKYRSIKKQAAVCRLVGINAKNAGKWKFLWKWTGNIHWQGKKIKRMGAEYQDLLRRAYRAMRQNETFANALADSCEYELTHSIGKSHPRKTILTEEEFIGLLYQMRSEGIEKPIEEV